MKINATSTYQGDSNYKEVAIRLLETPESINGLLLALKSELANHIRIINARLNDLIQRGEHL